MRITASLALLGAAASIALAAPAHAACGDASLMKSSAWQGDKPGLTLANFDSTSIVGMWNVQFQGSGGFTDFGYQQWHSDGTEFMNSGGRPPVIQNFCLGVWEKIGANGYKLNHWALSYNTDGSFAGRVNIKEMVTLAPGGMSFSGTFSIDVYTPQDALVGTVTSGSVSGRRVTVN